MGGGGKTTSSTSGTIAPELIPVFKQTGSLIADIQPQIVDQFSQFFAPAVQQIPGFTPGQEAIRGFQAQRAFGDNVLTGNEIAAQNQLRQLIDSPVGSSPLTQASMQAIRDPILNDLALAGLGNSSAIADSLGGAFAPILAQEMALRGQAVQQLQGLGSTEANRQSQFLSDFGRTEEAARSIQEAQGQAALSDLLRRQQLGTQFSTGLLGSFPFVTGQTTSSKGGGK